jgi:hypothetical protein
MFKTGTIPKRSKWLNRPMPDLFSRLLVRTISSNTIRKDVEQREQMAD